MTNTQVLDTPPTKPKRTRKPKASEPAGRPAMTDGHKAALAEGREQGRAVRRYLEALETYQPKRGRKKDLSNIEARLQDIEERMELADPLTRLHLAQQRIDLQNALDVSDGSEILLEAQEAFIEAAAGYSERKGITYASWRQVGVPPEVLKRAGISRSS